MSNIQANGFPAIEPVTQPNAEFIQPVPQASIAQMELFSAPDGDGDVDDAPQEELAPVVDP
jgi:hypothetical protein